MLGLILEPDLKVKNIEPPKATFTQSNNLKISGTNLKMCKFQNLIVKLSIKSNQIKSNLDLIEIDTKLKFPPTHHPPPPQTFEKL